MSDQYIGEIRIFGCNYAPAGWAFCDGQILPISQNTALFTLLGATYGGDGKTTFALPDLRGLAVTGTVDNQSGKRRGSASVTLTEANMPNHSHTAYVDIARPASTTAAGRMPGRYFTPNNDTYIASDKAAPLTALAPQVVQAVGGGTPHENRQPYQVVNFCIALQGDFPPRP
ncbi:tail Collar domain-containing protein [Jeongeupia sp. HS-3]|uniref:phage tail protein n=1 Tax=Jeongeupia sp. HS-3 TaxID=1009682 RepID=UPI0018A3A904|nr:tail fiber protein [Jeongeupia sp. HS-3]BCL76185.1 tail Collar domain-containing protein [Jeongeupia sp. HS-3]